MKNLPKFNKWILLFAVALVSLAITFFTLFNSGSKNPDGLNKESTKNTSRNSNIPTPQQLVKQKTVSVKLQSNLEDGYVSVFLTSDYVLDHGELLFNLNGATRYSKIEEESLFEKYFSAVETDKTTGKSSFRLGVSKGIEGVSLNPGKDMPLAKIYFSNLTQNSVVLDESQSTFFVGGGAQEGDPEYKVVLVK